MLEIFQVRIVYILLVQDRVTQLWECNARHLPRNIKESKLTDS